MSFIVVLIAVQYSVMALMMSIAFIVGPMAILINSFPNRKLFGYAIEDQVKDILSSVGLCCIIGVALYLISLLNLHYLIILLLQCVVGGSLYLICACVFKVRGIREYAHILGPKTISKLPGMIQPYYLKLYNYINR